jgi:hypothetical protein
VEDFMLTLHCEFLPTSIQNPSVELLHGPQETRRQLATLMSLRTITVSKIMYRVRNHIVQEEWSIFLNLRNWLCAVMRIYENVIVGQFYRCGPKDRRKRRPYKWLKEWLWTETLESEQLFLSVEQHPKLGLGHLVLRFLDHTQFDSHNTR